MEKHILITGASGNLGQATVEYCLDKGHRVIALTSAGKGLGYTTTKPVDLYQVDLTNEPNVEQVIGEILSEHRTIDAAILTVGGFAMGTVETTNGDAIQKMINLNFSTAYFVARPVFQHMMAKQSGSIVLIGAKPALEASAGKNSIAYTLSKTLIFELAELLNAEAVGKNVSTRVVVPNIIDTPANRQAMPTANFSKWLSPKKIAAVIHDLVLNLPGTSQETIIKLYPES